MSGCSCGWPAWGCVTSVLCCMVLDMFDSESDHSGDLSDDDELVEVP